MSKSNKPMIRIHDTETNEIIDREMNDAEFAQYTIDQEHFATKKAEAQAQIERKLAAQAKLEALGLSVEDLIALGL
jgi:hypothetical protein